jgi:hypothetical protein
MNAKPIGEPIPVSVLMGWEKERNIEYTGAS